LASPYAGAPESLSYGIEDLSGLGITSIQEEADNVRA
jgi:hypothetical protein